MVDEMVIDAPSIARHAKAGNFVVLRLHEKGERIPLTIADSDNNNGAITLLYQKVGKTTNELGLLKPGDSIKDIVGPLGHPTPIMKYGHCVLVGGGIGTATLYPILKALRDADNRITVILGARTRELLVWEDKFREHSDELVITTDDGSSGRKGLVTEALKETIERDPVEIVIAVGPIRMMKAVSELTKPYGVKTIVSLNPIMVEGTGMCGACRVTIEGKTRFACIDGPEFDGHEVNFQELENRLNFYKKEEEQAYHLFLRKTKRKEAEGSRGQVRFRNPEKRKNDFKEVSLGLTERQAVKEAARCLQCKKPHCVAGCPVEINIPKFISFIKEKDYLGGLKKIREFNMLPAICGRVCPQETQCQGHCILGKKKRPVSIGALERFVADHEVSFGQTELPEIPAPNGHRVAVIGSGPAGLTVAADLAKLGYDITVFEALHEAGGVLTYGIPEFRLPKKIIHREIEFVKNLGVKIILNNVIGRTQTVNELFAEGYEAVFIGVGAVSPKYLGIPGENLNNVYFASEFLTRVNLMKAYKFPVYDTPVKKARRVAVIGGGNVAMDSARTALRLGAEKVYIVYRRTEHELPSRHEEVENAKEEGIEFLFLSNPKEIVGDDKAYATALRCDKMVLCDPDESGRRKPKCSGEEFTVDIDQVIMAIGQTSNPILVRSINGLNLWGEGYITADRDGKTNIKGIFAGGDITTGAATVISAMGAGKRAARAIDDYIKGVTGI